jgi:hypothetical protein
MPFSVTEILLISLPYEPNHISTPGAEFRTQGFISTAMAQSHMASRPLWSL